jgi:hypothetical protein
LRACGSDRRGEVAGQKALLANGSEREKGF